MSNFAWRPPHRPPAADASLVGRIAAIGPAGKCLQIALDELLAEDQDRAGDDVDDDDRPSGGDNESCRGGSGFTGKESDGATGIAHDVDNDKRSGEKRFESGEKSEDLDAAHVMDESISEAILGEYCKAVAETVYDEGRGESSSQGVDRSVRLACAPHPTASSSAPAAILTGEVDHYNRIGGQWRVVVKNAVLKRRRMAVVDNGKTGAGKRKRKVLDWDNDDDGGENAHETGAPSKSKCEGDGSASVLHRFRGPIQILAYDDT